MSFYMDISLSKSDDHFKVKVAAGVYIFLSVLSNLIVGSLKISD